MLERIRHRHLLAVPFLLILLLTALGGAVNGVDARGRLVDDYTGEPIANGAITVGQRRVTSGEDGTFLMPDVPRTTRLRIDASGYFLTNVTPEAGDVRMSPNSLTLQVNDSTKTENAGIASAQIRSVDGSRSLATVNTTGNTVISPHPGADSPMLFCAPGYEPKQVAAHGVLMFIDLSPSETGNCPPLPDPSPSPSPAAP